MNRLFFIFIFLFLYLNVYAQKGIIGGMNFTNINFKPFNYQQLKIEPSKKLCYGVHSGYFMKFKIKDNFYIQPELLATVNCSKIKISDSLNTLSNVKLHNFKFNIPILFGYNFGVLDLNLGPCIDYNFVSIANYENSEYSTFWDVPNQFNLNFQFSVGCVFDAYQISLKYEQGITKYKHSIREIYSTNKLEFKSYNNQILITLRYSM